MKFVEEKNPQNFRKLRTTDIFWSQKLFQILPTKVAKPLSKGWNFESKLSQFWKIARNWKIDKLPENWPPNCWRIARIFWPRNTPGNYQKHPAKISQNLDRILSYCIRYKLHIAVLDYSLWIKYFCYCIFLTQKYCTYYITRGHSPGSVFHILLQ